MCDFSLQHVRSRPAQVGDKLVTRNFGTGTTGFASADDLDCAVCVKPGTEIDIHLYSVAIFRQIHKDKVAAHHDALEMPDGEVKLLTTMKTGMSATILQLPAEPKNAQEAEAQRRLEVIG